MYLWVQFLASLCTHLITRRFLDVVLMCAHCISFFRTKKLHRKASGPLESFTSGGVPNGCLPVTAYFSPVPRPLTLR